MFGHSLSDLMTMWHPRQRPIRRFVVRAGNVFLLGLALAALTACSSSSRVKKTPAVAVVIGYGTGARPSPTELAELHRLVQPEIERRGYTIARSSRSADYFALVQFPYDPQTVTQFRIVRAEPTVPFLNSNDAWEPASLANYQRTIQQLTTQPK